ncbi:MAG: hypothetical protein A3B91_00660 [Candidatus Yanofskybacteria bacterium RIFCSPHIGHO2_02_FULL_41_29]|nr:MAG: hypothetical protein A3B91_00660 [Candidatus Yanofskybacteria bacterium RIFCSPHIGHO2_02_FULL_41_29]OGN17979.1 MAG: hypothetical protein A3F48_04750 [Candidatus Yanofskybacteria bacterium RIFCSPHIGHO2_12_FULL_41_9]OGN29239.1 MAG: hypothetical protein A3H54_03640 [Candidatus Yanofskybacteria bacterium RIFCSPLOWO2_02_FULL_41_13]OGN34827.1 MAG: hypothetical protein A3F98_01110 [Candidatus Yanofskybacteria bacterium RIFCSPLOWO2_12_FULL_41_8]
MIISAPENISDFLKSRDSFLIVKDKKTEFRVLDKDPRHISFDGSFKLMTISAKGIANLSNYYNQIGLLQVYYRFLGTQSIEDDIFLLHGSAAISNNGRTVLFGDSGRSIGKTLSSMELARLSSQYIADEFVFFDINSFEIFSDDNIPIHARQKTVDHFAKEHGMVITNEFFDKQELGWKFIKKAGLDLIVYVNFSEGKEGLEELSTDIAAKYAMVTLSAHLEKMLNPSLDRFQFDSQKDMVNMDNSQFEKARQKVIFDRLSSRLKDASLKIGHNIPSFELSVKTPCSVPLYIDTITSKNR